MSPTRDPVGATQERLARVMPGFLRRSLELRMVFAATVIGLLLIALLLTFVTDRIRSEVFEDQKDAILLDARQRVSVAQAEFDSTTGVATVDEVNAEVQEQVNSIKDSISASGGIGVIMERSRNETSATVANDLRSDTNLTYLISDDLRSKVGSGESGR